MNCAVQWTTPKDCSLTSSLTELSIDEILNGHLIDPRVNNTHFCTLLSIMHPQCIIIDSKLAHDFIDTVLLSMYSHVIELVLIAIWCMWLLLPFSTTNKLVSIATVIFFSLISV